MWNKKKTTAHRHSHPSCFQAALSFFSYSEHNVSSILFIKTHLSYLQMAAEGCVVQRRAARPFRHIHVAEQRDEGLGAAHGLVGRGYVQRSLPVLVPGIHVCRVFQQHLDGVLRGESATPTSGSQVDLGDEGGAKVLPREACTHLTAGRHGPVQRREPFVIFGVDPGTCQSEGKHLEHDRGCAPTN